MPEQRNHRRKKPPQLTRRQFLGLSAGALGISTAGWLLWRYRADVPSQITETIARIPELPKIPTSPSPPPPREPVILPHEENYADFLSNLGLRYLTPREIISPHRRERNGVANVLPPRKYWNRMVPTLKMADELRHRLGVKLLYITSAYRSPEYNAECPGASPGSYHTKNLALDLVYDCPAEMAMDEARKMRAEGLFRGGLGLYQTFIYLDTRGRNANWG